MRTRMLLLLSSAVAIAAMPALAADYDPPIIIEEAAAPWVPVEIGSGWYLRGDLGYDVQTPLYDIDEDEDFDTSRLSGSIGFGYHFNDLFRADLNVGYLGGDDYSDGIVSASYSSWNGLANAYLDLGTVVGITPYVGAGVGLTYTRQEASIPGFSIADRQYNFSYALMAGASYRLAPNTSLDVGYQFLDTPNLEYLDLDSGDVRTGHKQHLIKVGLRYDLW